MVKNRKSPSESATLYQLETKKYGNDGNIWIISENKNKIKKWKLYKKITDNKFTKLCDAYHIPKIIPDNWKKWLEKLNTNQKKLIYKIRKSYKYLEERGIPVIEIILPLSDNGFYHINYAWDYSKLLCPNLMDSGKSYLLVMFELDSELNLVLYNNQLNAQHSIEKKDKKIIFEFIENFNKSLNGQCKWTGSVHKTLIFYI